MKFAKSLLEACLVAVTLSLPAAAADAEFDRLLDEVRATWATINYRTPEPQRVAAFEKLMTKSADFAKRYPSRPEALIWDGIVASTYAGARGGIGALTPAKLARTRFEQALEIDEKALDGSAHTSLGTLYHKVPGFPIAFGNDRKARTHLEQALAIAPAAIDANFFFAELLYDEGEYERALRHLETAKRAPPRPCCEIADAGRHAEIDALIRKVKDEL
ncbi:MAG: hypothetical protein FJ197_05585 [Gammaproteobacteria bacterium]|nr:hypothetical protein [Gammaproteobacteria bacterium]